jgi:hypothetical protein
VIVARLALRNRYARNVCAPVVAGDGEGQVTFLKRLGSMDEYPLLAYQSASTPTSAARRSALIEAGSSLPSQLGGVGGAAETLTDDGETVVAFAVVGPVESTERACG